MKTENQQVRRNRKQKLGGGIIVKLMLVVFSFVHAHWVPVACAAGTVVAASMFGDKAHWINIGKETEKIIAEKTPQDAVSFIEAEIAKYSQWKQENPDRALYTDKEINDLYFQLAKAKEAAGFAKKEVVSGYKRAITSPSYGGEALEWLFGNISADKYKDCIKTALQASTDRGQNFGSIAKQLESKSNWMAFKLFLDVAFDETKDSVTTAKSIESILKSNDKWKGKFLKYCLGEPYLIEYVYEKDYKEAQRFIEKEDFVKAAGAYRDKISNCNSSKEKLYVELMICKCLFNAGEYRTAISELENFLKQNKAKNRKLAKEALLLKGQCYIQQGEVDKATNEFLTFMIEYPETKQAPEANFFIGYCYMLQGKFDQAKEALNLVAKDYPQSSYASKARLCLTRIESMTE